MTDPVSVGRGATTAQGRLHGRAALHHGPSAIVMPSETDRYLHAGDSEIVLAEMPHNETPPHLVQLGTCCRLRLERTR